jgi:hypothetical protein
VQINTPGNRYPGYAASKKVSIDALCDATNPGLQERVIEHLEEQERVAQHQASPGERYRQMREPFVALEAEVQRYSRGVHIDKVGALLLLSLMASFALFCVPYFMWNPAPIWLSISAVAGWATLALLPWFVVHLIVCHARCVRSRYGQHLAASLAALNPSETELRAVLDAIEREQLASFRKVGKAWLLQSVMSLQNGDSIATESTSE